MTSIETLDYVGVGLFAATGALAASRKQLDIQQSKLAEDLRTT